MLALPDNGIKQSIQEHNVEVDVLCDWIEANLLFEEDEFSTTDMVDCLLEEHICKEEDLAHRIVADARTELKRRQACVGKASPFRIEEHRISRLRTWEKEPAHSFCVLLSLTKWYDGLGRQFGTDYTEQGRLFEELTNESLGHQFGNWKTILTGWSRAQTGSLTGIVTKIAAELSETTGDIVRWTADESKDAGLDLVLYRPFPDGRVGIPVYLIQCASGANWDKKVHTPAIELWTKIIQFTAEPKKGFAMPFALMDREFIRKCTLVNGILFDRYRILAAGAIDGGWVSSNLQRKLIKWCKPRVRKLPRREV